MDITPRQPSNTLDPLHIAFNFVCYSTNSHFPITEISSGPEMIKSNLYYFFSHMGSFWSEGGKCDEIGIGQEQNNLLIKYLKVIENIDIGLSCNSGSIQFFLWV